MVIWIVDMLLWFLVVNSVNNWCWLKECFFVKVFSVDI